MVKCHRGERLPQVGRCRWFRYTEDTGRLTQKIAVREGAAVAFFIKADFAIIQVLIKAADMLLGYGALEDHLTGIFNIRSFTGDQAIEAHLEQPWINGRLAATGGDYQFMTV